VAPRNAIEAQLAGIWCALLGLERVGIHDDFFALGGHSLLAVRLFARIEQAFGRQLPIVVLFQNGTIRHLASLIRSPVETADTATVVPMSPHAGGRSLFLMPGLGGEIMLSFANALTKRFGKRISVYGVQPAVPPRDIDQSRDLRSTAQCLASALRKKQPHGPYAVAGYSFGGMVAFEVARLLTESGEKVDLLAVIDTGPEFAGIHLRLRDRARKTVRIVANLPAWLRSQYIEFAPRPFMRKVARKLRRIARVVASGGRAEPALDDILDVGDMPLWKRELMQVNLAAHHAYIPRHYRGVLTLVRARTSPIFYGSSPDLGWTRWVDRLEIRYVDASHDSIIQPRHLEKLAGQLEHLLTDRTVPGT